MVGTPSESAAGSRPIIAALLPRFACKLGEISLIRPLGEGNINDTYLVIPTHQPPVVVQRINASVFPDPVAVVSNVAAVSAHLNQRLSDPPSWSRGFTFFLTVGSEDGANHVRDENGDVWRMLSYITDSRDFEQISDPHKYHEAGRLLGSFHRLLSDFDHRRLDTALPGFHDLSRYCGRYLEAVAAHRRATSVELSYCIAQAEDRLETRTLEQRNEGQGAAQRVIHGDPKSDNFLFRRDFCAALALIDLDTVAAGLLAYDLGDSLRSLGNPAGEKPPSANHVHFNVEICRRFLAGYRASGIGLNEAETEQIYHGVRLLTFELGLRFLTDYLENDSYFKVQDPQENLRRAVVQFRLLESIEQQRGVIESIALGT
jgi:Ser/Thr protein kinase RdoA (MazF antagonist)